MPCDKPYKFCLYPVSDQPKSNLFDHSHSNRASARITPNQEEMQ